MARSSKNHAPGRKPPASLEELWRRVREAQEGGAGSLGRRSLDVLVNMLEEPSATAVASISEIARRNGVDPSTLTRLGQRLGYDGFAPLQDVFRRHTARDGRFYSRHVAALIEGDRPAPAARGSLGQLAERECRNVLATLEKLSERDLEKAVDLILGARTVYVLALRATYGIAYVLGSFLTFLRRNVVILAGPGYSLASDLAQLDESDLLVALTFRPYTKLTIAACEVAKKKGVPIVALTDGASPVAVDGKHGVTLRTYSPFHFDSGLANLFLAEALLAGVAQRLGPDAVREIGRHERLFEELDVETE